ncbi:hypothetical protein BDV30DRAFT_245143 [Aspergillus minisclerotigenes]|uniref:Uncharacterized protein n=1 Tax=Aspergillus minisclerotigenes TaxID=656917 RepID=A0A5N6IJJ9_9EURO|nr:hypothetical protein BDV30DRAFT_245143 [Aspergillus minisclerotigenes]
MQLTWSILSSIAATTAAVYLPEAGSNQEILFKSKCKESHVYCGRRLTLEHGYSKHDILNAIDISPGHPISALEHPEDAVFTCGKYGVLIFVDFCDYGCKRTSEDHDHCKRESQSSFFDTL